MFISQNDSLDTIVSFVSRSITKKQVKTLKLQLREKRHHTLLFDSGGPRYRFKFSKV